jgi:hypothetical protein
VLFLAAPRVSIPVMNVIRITGAAFVLALPFFAVACSSDNTSKSSEGSSTHEDGGSTVEGGATGPVSTCTVSDEGDGCHDTSCPCTLLTTDQVSAAVGVTVGAPDNGTGMGGDPHNCVWTYKAAAPSTDKVTVYLTTNIAPPSFEGTCGGKPSNGVTTTAVSGVGDTACYTVIAEGIGTNLNFQKNCWAYSISISATGTLKSMFTNDTIEADEKTLAQEVASKY